MTTKVHIINFGPDPVKVEAMNEEGFVRIDVSPTILHAHQYFDPYVYPSHDIKITEIKKVEE